MESILRKWIDYETQTGASSTEHPLEHVTATTVPLPCFYKRRNEKSFASKNRPLRSLAQSH